MYATVKGRGSTVIELLIIVIIIAVLVSIVIPALFTAKQKARQIIYVNNLRQLFLTFEQYTNDNSGLLPRPNNSGTSKDGTKICNAEVWFKDGIANNYEGYYGSIAQRHSKAANILFINRHVERIQNGNTDGTRNEGWPNGQDGS